MSYKDDPMFKDIMEQLKKLSSEDRVLLGLYLYEGLSSEQVTHILGGNRQYTGRKKELKKALAADRIKRV